MQPAIKNNYEIAIPNEKEATYRVVTFIIALINVLVFVYLYFNETIQGKRIFALVGAVLAIISIVFYCIKLRAKHLSDFKIEYVFVLLSLVWFLYGNFWLGLLVFLFAVLGFYTNKKPVIIFRKDGINYPSFPPKLFQWSAVDFAMLKDGILTIEMKDNHLFQFTLTKAEYDKLDEIGFNNFCKQYCRN
ncbi:MAG: hypothetical protein H7Y86_11180 [Rhizobacter sp.]|nr:hypothetical protein [Ferruginibacter sp.]